MKQFTSFIETVPMRISILALAAASVLCQLNPVISQTTAFTEGFARKAPASTDLRDTVAPLGGRHDHTVAEASLQSDHSAVGAATFLDRRYTSGEGVPQKVEEGLERLRGNGEAADPEAQARLGWRFLFHDDALGYDPAEAMHLLRKAAERGSGSGAVGVAVMYRHGIGVTRNDSAAVRWLHEAEILGTVPAALLLGIIHDDPASALYDPAKAKRYYNTALTFGGPDLFCAWAEAYAGGTTELYPVPRDLAVADRIEARMRLLGYLTCTEANKPQFAQR